MNSKPPNVRGLSRQAYIARLLNFFRDRGALDKCDTCGSGDRWNLVEQEKYSPLIPFSEEDVWRIDSPTHAVIMLECENCGYIRLFGRYRVEELIDGLDANSGQPDE